ncbi:hypothetical protein C0J52_22014 [Blattella germanica]|nr:hypothetical protein C0J52_22014 [Blattella germanica]
MLLHSSSCTISCVLARIYFLDLSGNKSFFTIEAASEMSGGVPNTSSTLLSLISIFLYS